MKTLHTYIEVGGHQIHKFNPTYPETNRRVISSYFTMDGSMPRISEAVTATFEEIDDLAESMNIDAWNNQH